MTQLRISGKTLWRAGRRAGERADILGMSRLAMHRSTAEARRRSTTETLTLAAILSLSVSSFTGCSQGPDDGLTPTPTPAVTPTPEPTPTPAAFEVVESTGLTREPLVEGPADFAAGLPDQSVYFQQDGVLSLRDPFTGAITALTYEDGPLAAGDLSSAVQLNPDGLHLLTGKVGVLVVSEGSLMRSPLTDLLEDEGTIRALSAPGPEGDDLWLATEVGLRLYRSGRLYQVNVADLPATSAQLSYGALQDGAPGLWVLSQKSLYAIVDTGTGFELWDYRFLGEVQEVACTHDGLLWVLQDGQIKRRLPLESGKPEQWNTLPLPESVQTLWAGQNAIQAWALTPEQTYLLSDGRIETSAEPLASVVLGGDPTGRLLTRDTSGQTATLVRRLTGRPIQFLGLEYGGVLTGPTSLYLFPTLADSVTGLSVVLDDQPAPLQTEPWHLDLDPLTLAEGLHFMTATATYPDMPEGVTTELEFIVGQFNPPTWEDDIKPIYDKSCAKCHGTDSSAYRLDTAQAWVNKYDTILEYVTTQYMPLPPTDPLTEEQIYTLRSWQAGGFLEE